MPTIDDLGALFPQSRTRTAPLLSGTGDYATPRVSGAQTGISPFERQPPPVYGEVPNLAFPRAGQPAPQYTPPPVPGSTPTQQPQTQRQPFSGLNQGAIMQFLQGLGAPSSSALSSNFQRMIEMGLLPQGSYLEEGSTADDIYIPGYGWLDVLTGADTGNPSSWQYLMDGFGPSHMFNDPIGMWFGEQIEDILGQLRQPRQLPGEINDVYSILRQLATSGGGGGSGLGVNYGPDEFDTLRQLTAKRTGELNAEPYSQTEEAAMRVQAFDNLERSREVARQQTVERLAARGHAPSSGTVESALRQVDATFDALRAQNENALLTSKIDERQRRRSEAVSINQQFADRVTTRDMQKAGIDAQLQQTAAQVRSASEGRSLSAAQALAQLAQFMASQQDPTSKLMMMLQAIGMVPAYSQQQFSNVEGLVG